MTENTQEIAPKRPRPKKIKKPIGPFLTEQTSFNKGKERPIEVTIRPDGIEYRLKGMSDTYVLPHTVGYQRALSIKTGFDTGPRAGRIRRGEMSLHF